ncbi:MAG TPA: PQQ-dependent sugar dehydrogenase, partial [Solirubrobacteraceae bacterium]|nr:PQQ-dependent sugar dehydrogenase [Solirubrobacteraceae bacterium]
MRSLVALRMLVATLALAGLLAPAASAAAPLQPVDSRFQDETVLDGLESPMAVRFAPAPDGRIFVAEKGGRVLAFDDKRDTDPEVVVDLSSEVHDFWDRGLLGMALDPAFALNGRLYLAYTRDAAIGGTAPRWGDTCPDPPGAVAAGCVVSGALVRVTVGALGAATEVKTLIKDEWCQQYPSHTVGTVAFGPDGMLYMSAGDGASFTQRDWGQLPGNGGYPSNPCGDPVDEGGSMRSQDVRTPADPTGLSGAILRLDPATGQGAPGNPLAAGDAGARRLIAYGLRNPFRWAFRPGTDEIWLGDVGSQAWEELDVVADANDGAAENFGWPCFEGSGPQGGWGGVPGCQSLPESAVTKPRFEYEHGKEVVHGDGCRWNQGSSISGIAFPSGYGGDRAGNLFFADYSSVCIFAMEPGADGRPDPSTVSLFARGASGTGGPVELQDGPGGDLYYTYYDPVNPTQGSLHRIRYVPGNRTPVAAISAQPTSGPAPLAVSFSAAGSDPDGDDLGYAWDLDGDGAYDDATGVQAGRTYTALGTVRAGVRVTDPYGASAEAHVNVTAGNTPPRPVIEAPADGAPWSVGEPIAFRGSAQDDQETLGAGSLVWVLTLDHCPQGVGCHVHPLERVTGASGTITGPEHDYPSRIVLTLVATDSGGLIGSTSVKLEPRAALVHVKTDTAGTAVSLDGIEGADVQRTVIAGTRVTIAAEPHQHAGDALWEFGGWSDGVFAATRDLTPDADVTLTARFAPVATPTPTPAATAEPAPTPTADPGAGQPLPVAEPLRITVARPVARRIAAVVPLVASCAPACHLTARATLRA